MAVFCNKTSIDKLRKRMPVVMNSGFGYGLGGNDVTSGPQTIDQQPKAKTMNSPIPQVKNPSAQSNSIMSKEEINLSEQDLFKMLEES